MLDGDYLAASTEPEGITKSRADALSVGGEGLWAMVIFEKEVLLRHDPFGERGVLISSYMAVVVWPYILASLQCRDSASQGFTDQVGIGCLHQARIALSSSASSIEGRAAPLPERLASRKSAPCPY